MEKKSLTKKSLPIIAASVASVGFAMSSAVSAADLDSAKPDQGVEAETIDSKSLEEIKAELLENNLEPTDLAEESKNEEYSIKIDVKGEGTVSPEGLKTVRKGENVLLTITPGAGHKLESFKINGKNISLTNMSISGSESFSYKVENVEEDYHIEAIFCKIVSNLETLNSENSETKDLESSYSLENMQEDEVLAANASVGETFSLNGLNYKITSANEVELTGPDTFSGTLSIPSSVSYSGLNYSVTSIGDDAFWGSGLTSVTIPNSVTSIGNSAFRGCTSLTGDLTIPHSVTSIGNSAFISCSGLASLTISNGVESIGEYAFSSCKGFTGDLTIPGSVKSIGGNAFSGCTGLNGKLTILNGVISIRDYAFHNCSGLTGDLTIPNSVTSIGNNAFAYCSSLNGKLTMSNNVESIGVQAFLKCSGLANVTIPNSIESIGNSAFKDCSGLKYVKVEKKEAINIGSSVVSYTALKNGNKGAALYVYKGFKDSGGVNALSVPESVVHVIPEEAPAINNLSKKLKDGHPAFSWDSSEVATTYKVERKKKYGSYEVLQEKLTSSEFTDESIDFTQMSNYTYRITPYAYWNLNADNVDPYGNEDPLVGTEIEVQINRQFNDGKLVYEIQSANEVGVVSYIAEGLSGELNIPKSVTEYGTNFSVISIGAAAFDDCKSITGNLIIPDSVTSIGNFAFRGCTSLNGTLTIPSSVTRIGMSAFNNCSSLTGNLTIPDSITSIERGTFTYCRGLTGNLTIPDGVTSIGDDAFFCCTSLNGTLTIPNSVESIGKSAFSGCGSLTGDLTIPNSVTSIGKSAFNGCRGLDGKLTISNGVESIGESAFSGCSSLTGDLTIPNSVTSIGNTAFNGCRGLNGKLTISNSVESIGDSVFSGCSSLKGVLTLPSSVKSLGFEAFRNCSSLTSVVIPNSVTSIGRGAFRDCSGFEGNIEIPESIVSIEGGTFADSGISSVTIPNSITSIGNDAFNGCTNLINVTIPSSVASIEERVFENCTNLKYAKIERKEATNIASNVFLNTHIGNGDDGAALYVYKNFKDSGGVNALGVPEKVVYVIPEEAPGEISNLKLDVVDDKLKLSWKAPNGANAYKITREIGGAAQETLKAKYKSTELVDESVVPLESHKIYEYSVTPYAYYNPDAEENDPYGKEFIIGNEASTFTIFNDVKAQSYENGTIELGKSIARSGEDVTFTVSPNEHYVLKSGSVKLNGGAVTLIDKGNNQYSFTMPNEDVAVTAEFIDKQYKINVVNNDLEKGRIIINETEAIKNQTITVTVEPKEHYVLESNGLTVDGSTQGITLNGDGTYTFIMPGNDVTVTAEFVDKLYFSSVNSANIEHGTITVTDSGSKIGDPMVITVTPDEGYILKPGSLKVNGSSEGIKDNGDGTYTFTMPGANVNIDAEFVKEFPEINKEDEKTGLIIEAAEGALPYNSSVVVNEVDQGNENYTVVWEYLDEDIKKTVERSKFYSIEIHDINGQKIQPNEGYKVKISIPIPNDYDLNELQAIRVEPGEDVDYKSSIEEIKGKNYFTFHADHFSYYGMIDKNYHTIEISNDGVYDNGKIKVNGDLSQALVDEEVTVEVIPNASYILKPGSLKINGSSEGIKDNGDGTYTFKMPQENVKIDAEFVKEFEEFVTKDESTGVIIEVPEGAVPYGSYVYIEEVDKSHANYEMVWENLDDEIEKIVEKSKFYIIEIRDPNGQKIQPNEGYKVKINIPIPEEYDIQELQALRIESGQDVHYEGAAEEIEGKNYFVFEADHFSDYGVIDKNFNDIKASNEPDNGGKLELDESRVLIGEEVTIEVIPDEGYILKPGSLKINGSSEGIKDNGDGTYTFIMPGEDIDIDAEFVKEFPELSIKDENTGIKIEVPEGALPYGSSIFITEIKKENENYESVWKNLDEDVKENIGKFKFYNIEARDSNGNSVLLNKGYSAKFYIPVLEDFNLDTLKVLLIDSSKDLSYSANIEVIDGKKYAVFESDRFGYYGILDELKKDLNNDVIINNDNDDNDDNDTSNEINEGNEDNKNSSSSDEVYQKTSDERITPIIISLFSALISGIGCIISYFKKFLKSDNSK